MFSSRSIAFAAARTLSALLIAAAAGHTQAAEIKVLSAFGAKLIVDELILPLERTSNDKVTISYGQAGSIRKRILDGEAFDLVILPSGWNELRGKLTSDPAKIVHADLGIAVRADAPRPDTSTAEELRRTLLSAKSIIYTDPKTGGISGVLFASVIDRLGIADEVNRKSKLVADVFNAEFVAKGEADLAVQHAAEITSVPGVRFIPMPPEFQTPVTFSGAVAADAKAAAGAAALLRYLTGPDVAPAIKAKGYEPH